MVWVCSSTWLSVLDDDEDDFMPQFPFSTNHPTDYIKPRERRRKKEIPKVFYDLKRWFAAAATEDDDEAVCRKFYTDKEN